MKTIMMHSPYNFSPINPLHYQFHLDPDFHEALDSKGFQEHLERAGIETRPIVGSNLARQPVTGNLPCHVEPTPNADTVHYRGLLVPNNHNVTEKQVQHFVETVSTFVKRY